MLKEVSTSLNSSFISDVMQLESFCKEIDIDAFIPFTDSELSAYNAKLEERYYLVVAEVINCLLALQIISTSDKGIKRVAYRHGYTTSLYIDKYTITLKYDCSLWYKSNSEKSPFWLALRNDKWNQSTEIKKLSFIST